MKPLLTFGTHVNSQEEINAQKERIKAALPHYDVLVYPSPSIEPVINVYGLTQENPDPHKELFDDINKAMGIPKKFMYDNTEAVTPMPYRFKLNGKTFKVSGCISVDGLDIIAEGEWEEPKNEVDIKSALMEAHLEMRRIKLNGVECYLSEVVCDMQTNKLKSIDFVTHMPEPIVIKTI